MDYNKFYSVINNIEGHGGLGMRAPSGTCRMLYGLAMSIKPKTYLDIGTFIGLSCLWVARAMEEVGQGKIYTMELDPRWRTMAIDFAKQAGLSHRIEFILGDSREVIPNLPVSDVELVLLDSGNKDLYITDFENVVPKLSDKAIIFAHDTTRQPAPFHTATKFQDYIEGRKDYENFLIDYEWGTTLIRKR